MTVGDGLNLKRTVVSKRDSLFIVEFQLGEDLEHRAIQAWTYAISPSGHGLLLGD